MNVQPIETEYRGYRMRSRLEARWACFFDQLGVRWEYEPQGFETPHGPYLPDFWLPEVNERGVWFEVKSDGVRGQPDPRWTELAGGTGLPVIVAFGLPSPDPTEWHPDGNMEEWFAEGHGASDSYREFCICATCGRVGIQHGGDQSQICSHPDDRGGHTLPSERVLACYAAARSARFEHGESGPGVIPHRLDEPPPRPRMGPSPAPLGTLLPGVIRDIASRHSRGGAA